MDFADRGEDRPRRGARPSRGSSGNSNGTWPQPVGSSRGLGVHQVSPSEFELVHPRCVLERREDYEDAIAIWQAGEAEAARETLRDALDGCGDNIWIHALLGKIALETSGDLSLARAHFGYAVELVQRALPRSFVGTLPRNRPSNRPAFEAIDGLATCYDRLGQAGEAAATRSLASRWSPGRESGRPDSVQ